MRIVTNREPFKPPTRIEVCCWVQTAWSSLKTIENGFRVTDFDVDTTTQVEDLTRDLSLVELNDGTVTAIDESGSASEDE